MFRKIWRVPVRKGADLLLRLRPWSSKAFALALLATLAASLLQEAIVSVGVSLHFATFFVAIIVVSLLAGAPAGSCVAAIAIPIVWWEFLPPQFEFSPPRACCFLSESGFPALRLSDSSILLGPEASMDDPTAFG